MVDDASGTCRLCSAVANRRVSEGPQVLGGSAFREPRQECSGVSYLDIVPLLGSTQLHYRSQGCERLVGACLVDCGNGHAEPRKIGDVPFNKPCS